MRTTTRNKAALVAVVGGLALAAVPAAHADTVESTVSGGSLAVTTAGATLSGVTLNGTNQTASGTASSAWSIKDARGTGAAWTVAVSATAPTSAAGTVETTARTLPVANVKVTTGTVTAGTGSDPTTNITGSTALAMSTTSQTLVASTGNSKGTYSLTPTFDLVVPANAYRSNYSGTVGSTTLNPYVSTLTYTIS